MFKRLIDITLALTGLIFAFPVMLIVALAIRLETPGSVFFSQTRLGYKGKRFQVHKFRKFPENWGAVGANVTLANDVRRTAVGSFIERTKLDELPQLWNILIGEMSCVGPRPESVAYEDLFVGEYKALLDFKPGIFGPNQVEFRNESEMYPVGQNPEEFYRTVLFPKKAKTDIAYFSNSNCIGELWSVVRGVWVSFIGVVNWRSLVSSYAGIVLTDILAVEFSWLIANFIHFGFEIQGLDLAIMWAGLWLFPIFTLSALIIAGVYHTPARYFSSITATKMVIAVSTAWVITSIFILTFIERSMSSVLPPISLLLVLFIVSVRRIWDREMSLRVIKMAHAGDKKKVVIYGVGYRASNMAKLVEQGFPGTKVVGLIDDRLKMRGRNIGKHKVLGNEQDLDMLHLKHKFEQLWMSFSPSENSLGKIDNWCVRNQVKLVVLPNIEPFSALAMNSKHNNENSNNAVQDLTSESMRRWDDYISNNDRRTQVAVVEKVDEQSDVRDFLEYKVKGR